MSRVSQSSLFLPCISCLSPGADSAGTAHGSAGQWFGGAVDSQMFEAAIDREPRETLPGPCRRHNHHVGQRILTGTRSGSCAVIPPSAGWSRAHTAARLCCQSWALQTLVPPPDCLIGADASMSKVTLRSGQCQQQLGSSPGLLTSHQAQAGRSKAGWSSRAGSRWWSLPPQTHWEGLLSSVEEQHRQVCEGLFLMLQAFYW